MKKQLLLVLAIAGFITSAHGMEGAIKQEKICGELESKVEAPVCNVGQACPHFMRKVFVLKTVTDEITLETKSAKILAKFDKMVDETVCATGGVSEGSVMEVTSITRSISNH